MEAGKAIGALGALAHGTRLAIFRLLIRTGPEGLPAGAIADALDVHAATLSHHLGLLARADLLLARRAQRQVIYAAHADGLRALIAFLSQGDVSGEKPRMKVRAGVG